MPRGGFVKRGSRGDIVLLSPLPCPYNYGAVPAYLGLDGDLLDALVLGPRLAPGQTVTVAVWRAIGMTDRGRYDDKLICAQRAPGEHQLRAVLRFFKSYALAKRLLNAVAGRTGPTRCEGWVSAEQAIARAKPRAVRR